MDIRKRKEKKTNICLSTANRSIRTSQPMAIESLSKNEKQLDRDIASSTIDPWKYSEVSLILFLSLVVVTSRDILPATPFLVFKSQQFPVSSYTQPVLYTTSFGLSFHSAKTVYKTTAVVTVIFTIGQLALPFLKAFPLRLYSLLYIADAGAHAAETGQFNCPAQHNKRTVKTATEILFWKRRNRIRMSANVRAGHIYRPAYGIGRSIAHQKKMFTAVIYLNDGRVSEIPVDWEKKKN